MIAVLCLMALASCQKDYAGRAVQFNAKTHSSAPLTRTAYSGESFTDNNKTYERIDWVSGDQVRIHSDKAQTQDGQYGATYTISTITANGRYSESGLSGAGLLWGDGLGNYTFWGIYPPHDISNAGQVSGLSIGATQNVKAANRTESSTETPTFTHVTFAPDLSNAWMLACETGVSEGGTLGMDFYPAFTAFQFTLASQYDATITVNSFELSSEDTDIAGIFAATIAAGGASSIDSFSTGSPSISVSFGEGETVTQTKDLQFTVLALPRDIPKLTISFGITVNGASVTRSLALKRITPEEEFITFPACKKHLISGLFLPSGDLHLTGIVVNDWTEGAEEYNYISSVSSSLKCVDAAYRRYDSDSEDNTDWDGSHIVVSYGYQNPAGEIIATDDPEEFQIEENTLLRPAYSPILELATNCDSGNVLQLVLDNPRFRFVQYGNSGSSSGGIDMNVRDYSKTNRLDIVSGSGVKTFFSVVPVEQFTVDTPADEKTCRITLLSVSPGTLHEIPFNMTEDTPPVQALPGQDMSELKFMYFGPAEYGSTGSLID